MFVRSQNERKIEFSVSGIEGLAFKGDQVASWDLEARHGLFTKHLLDALYGAADRKGYGDGDGRVALGEVRAYLDYHMTRAACRTFGRHQIAWIKGSETSVLVKLSPK